MEFPVPVDFKNIFLFGVDELDLINLLNQNRLFIDNGKRKIKLTNPDQRSEVEIKGNQTIFSNNEIICFLLARALYDRYKTDRDLKAIFDRIRDVNDFSSYSKIESYFFYVLNLNEESWLELFDSTDKKGYYFFHVFNGFSESLSYRDIKPDIIIQIVRNNYAVLNSDGAFNSLLLAMNRRAVVDTAWAKEAFETISKIEVPIVHDLLPCIIKGISTSQGNNNLKDFIHENTSSTDLEKIKLGIMCLGFLTISRKEDIIWLESILASFASPTYQSDEIQILIIRAASNHVSVTFCQGMIEEYSKSPSKIIKAAVANAMFRNYENHQNELWFRNSLISLARDADTEKSIVHYLTMVLSQICKEQPNLFKDFFEKIIVSPSFDRTVPEIYKSQFTYFYNNNKPAFNSFISEWLNRDHPIYQVFLEIIFKEFFVLSYNKFQLDDAYLDDLTEEDLFFVVHKIVGFVNDNKAQSYLLLGCVKGKNCTKEVKDFIHEIFLDHICYNYPSTNDFLESIQNTYTDQVQEFIKKVVTDSRNYFEKRRTLKPVKEILGSDSRSKLFWSIRNKQSQEAFKNAQDSRSFFMSMAKQIGLKGGQYWFAKHEGVYQNKSELGKFEHGAEMPRGMFIDPVGQSLIQTRFRLYQRNT